MYFVDKTDTMEHLFTLYIIKISETNTQHGRTYECFTFPCTITRSYYRADKEEDSEIETNVTSGYYQTNRRL